MVYTVVDANRKDLHTEEKKIKINSLNFILTKEEL